MRLAALNYWAPNPSIRNPQPDAATRMADWPKKLSREALRDIISQTIWSYWPVWGAPIVSAVLAYSEGYPPTIIFMTALAAFALVALALNNFWQWTAAQSPSGRVDFLAPAVAAKTDDGSPPGLEGIKLGVVLRSTASFPMEIRIDELETQIGDRVPTQAFYVRSIEVSRGIGAQFMNALIKLSDLERANQTIYGHINASVTYGRPGRLKYPVEQQWYMAFKFDKAGNLVNAEPSLTSFVKPNGS